MSDFKAKMHENRFEVEHCKFKCILRTLGILYNKPMKLHYYLRWGRGRVADHVVRSATNHDSATLLIETICAKKTTTRR